MLMDRSRAVPTATSQSLAAAGVSRRADGVHVDRMFCRIPAAQHQVQASSSPEYPACDFRVMEPRTRCNGWQVQRDSGRGILRWGSTEKQQQPHRIRVRTDLETQRRIVF